MKKAENIMTSLLHSMNTTQNRGINLYSGNNAGDAHQNSSRSDIYFSPGPSLAEKILSRYNGGDNGWNKVPTKIHPSSGLEHPYDQENNLLSRFPITFQDCLNC